MELAELWRHQCEAEAGATAATKSNPKGSSNNDRSHPWLGECQERQVACSYPRLFLALTRKKHRLTLQWASRSMLMFSEHHVPSTGLRTEQVAERGLVSVCEWGR